MTERRRRVVCMCEGGNCRSVALAYILKHRGMEAVAIGHTHSGDELKEALFTWADSIVVLERHMCAFVPIKFMLKTRIFDVGPDKWFGGYNQDLMKILTKMIEELGV